MRAPNEQLTNDEEEQLQRILAESFDTSHPDFDQRQAMINLHRNFAGTAALCCKCLIVKAKTDLTEELCPDCYAERYPPSSLEAEQRPLTSPIAELEAPAQPQYTP